MATKRSESRSVFRSRDLEGIGLTRRRLQRMVQAGEAERVARGLYRGPAEATELDTVALVSARVPHGIVCLLSALAIHRLGTQVPDEVWIAVDAKARKPRIQDLAVRVVRFSGPMLTYGIEERQIQGVPVKITSPARTLVDCFRYRNKIGLDVALEALKDAVGRRRVPVDKILRAAEVCRASTVVKPYLEAVLA